MSSTYYFLSFLLFLFSLSLSVSALVSFTLFCLSLFSFVLCMTPFLYMSLSQSDCLFLSVFFSRSFSVSLLTLYPSLLLCLSVSLLLIFIHLSLSLSSLSVSSLFLSHLSFCLISLSVSSLFLAHLSFCLFVSLCISLSFRPLFNECGIPTSSNSHYQHLHLLVASFKFNSKLLRHNQPKPIQYFTCIKRVLVN